MDDKKKVIIISIIVILGIIIGLKTGLIVGFEKDTYFKENISLEEGSTTVINEKIDHKAKLVSSDENIVSIENGKIVGKKPGKAIIEIKKKNKVIGEYEVTVEAKDVVPDEPTEDPVTNETQPNPPVTPDPVTPVTPVTPDKPKEDTTKPSSDTPKTPDPVTPKPTTVAVSKIEIINKSESLTIGNKVVINYKISPDNATNKSVTWTSSNTGVATVNNGEVTAKGVGTATITVKTNNGKTATATISVVSNEIRVTGVTLNKVSESIKVGETTTLTANVTPGNATNRSVTWASSNTSIATVTNGVVTGIKTGTVTITAKTNNGLTASCNITVNPNEIAVSGVTLDKTTASIKEGESVTLTATVSPSNATNKSITWTSSNTSVATVTNGVVKGVKAGTATITAKSNNGKTATSSVTVTQASCGASKIHFMNTGESDAILIESCGHYGLVDSSNPFNDGTAWSVSEESQTVEHVIKYIKKVIGCSSCKGKLDFVIATHSHSDHVGGMPRIASVFANSKTTYYYRQYVRTYEDDTTNWDNNGYYYRAYTAMKNAGAKMTEVTGKTPTINFYDLTIKIVNTNKVSSDELSHGVAEGENKNAMIQLVTHKNGKKVVLSADMESQDEARIKSSIGKVDVLKAGHHSYGSANSNGYIKALKADNVIVTNNKFIGGGKPNICYAKLVNSSAKVYLTGNATDAIVLTFTDTSYNIKNQSGGNVSTSNPCKGVGWMKAGCWYYYDSSGSPLKGWQQLSWSQGTNWFYFKSDGCMLANTTQTIGGKSYHFDSNGVCDSAGC